MSIVQARGMGLFQALGQSLKIPELRRKLLFTLGLLLAYRVLASVPIPGANGPAYEALVSSNGLFGVLNLFSGAGLRGFTIVGLGLNPYINATIIFQLLTVISVRLKDLAKEGERGRKKITMYTRWLTVALSLVQSWAIVQYLDTVTEDVGGTQTHILSDTGTGAELTIIVALTAGTIMAMWLGELITEYGVGNGVSLIIFSGILGRIPSALIQQIQLGSSSILPLIGLGLAAVIVTAFIIEVQQAQRRVPTQTAQRIVNVRSGLGSQGGRRNFLPLRINTAGVIPIIFAISLMQVPAIFANFFTNASGWLGSLASWLHSNWQPTGGPIYVTLLYNVFYFALVFGFTYFYTAIIFDPVEVSENMKKSAMFIPGIRPGQSTAAYLGKVMGRLTFFGALFLAVISVVLPIATQTILHEQNNTVFYLGGTAILIVVGVALDTMKQIESQLQMRQYRGFIR